MKKKNSRNKGFNTNQRKGSKTVLNDTNSLHGPKTGKRNQQKSKQDSPGRPGRNQNKGFETNSHRPKMKFKRSDRRDSKGLRGNKRTEHGNESDEPFQEVSLQFDKSIENVAEGGFPCKEDSDCEMKDTRALVLQQNRKNKKSGGFQSMGLSHGVFKGIMKKGYRIPTPIQRKTIPLLMDGKDVVAMARTGSGKTAAFLIPMFERLKVHLTSGTRALILSPTRELALQTLKFVKELGKFTGLKSSVILGGDKVEDQFASIHENPDIMIATPGRLIHVLVEMDMKLKSMEYVVFDEADRLFEMGFAEHINGILALLPETRQTVLFSATLPKLLVEFAKAGLHDPTLIRLDVDTKLSQELKLSFLQCRAEDKVSILCYLLREVVKPTEQTLVFVATKHHAEYLNMILTEAGINCSYTYSALDQTARKINVAKFRNKKTMVLIVTDLAARGIDIPMLDNVINFNFPAKSKLFVHRVGRVARAGRTGTAYSLVAHDEVPYVFDLHLFLGRPMKYVLDRKTYNANSDGLFGAVARSVIDGEDEVLRLLLQKTDIKAMEKVVSNAYGQYIRSRPAPSSESIKRCKELTKSDVKLDIHPLFGECDAKEAVREELLNSMKDYRPHSTIFEVNATNKTEAFVVMKDKRRKHSHVIDQNIQRKADKPFLGQTKNEAAESNLDENDESELQEIFSKVVAPKRSLVDVFHTRRKKKKLNTAAVDQDYYVSYRPKDFASERGFSLGTSFEREADTAMLDMTGDDNEEIQKGKNQMKWDRKKKKFIRETGNEAKNKKKVKTESGAWVSASYKTNLYKEWLEKNKAAADDDSDSDDAADWRQSKKMQNYGNNKRGRYNRGRREFPADKDDQFSKRGKKSEMKTKEQILKERRKKSKLYSLQKHRQEVKSKRKSMAGQRGKRSR